MSAATRHSRPGHMAPNLVTPCLPFYARSAHIVPGRVLPDPTSTAVPVVNHPGRSFATPSLSLSAAPDLDSSSPDQPIQLTSDHVCHVMPGPSTSRRTPSRRVVTHQSTTAVTSHIAPVRDKSDRSKSAVSCQTSSGHSTSLRTIPSPVCRVVPHHIMSVRSKPRPPRLVHPFQSIPRPASSAVPVRAVPLRSHPVQDRRSSTRPIPPSQDTPRLASPVRVRLAETDHTNPCLAQTSHGCAAD